MGAVPASADERRATGSIMIAADRPVCPGVASVGLPTTSFLASSDGRSPPGPGQCVGVHFPGRCWVAVRRDEPGRPGHVACLDQDRQTSRRDRLPNGTSVCLGRSCRRSMQPRLVGWMKASPISESRREHDASSARKDRSGRMDEAGHLSCGSCSLLKVAAPLTARLLSTAGAGDDRGRRGRPRSRRVAVPCHSLDDGGSVIGSYGVSNGTFFTNLLRCPFGMGVRRADDSQVWQNGRMTPPLLREAM